MELFDSVFRTGLKVIYFLAMLLGAGVLALLLYMLIEDLRGK